MDQKLSTRPSISELRRICHDPVMNHESWFGRVWARPICLRMTWILSSTRIRANHITCTWLGLGLAAGFFFCIGNWYFSLVGVICIQLIYVLDGVDGELARYHGPTKLGETFETISHHIVYVLMPFALGIGWYAEERIWMSPVIGAAASIFYALSQVEQLGVEKMLLLHPGTDSPSLSGNGTGSRDNTVADIFDSAMRKFSKYFPVYPISLTIFVILDKGWLWTVIFSLVFFLLWMSWIQRYIRTASLIDKIPIR